MKKILSTSLLLLTASLFTTALTVYADVLTLKDGQTITGKFISKDANNVVFEIAGQQLKFDSAKVTGISFGELVSVSSSMKNTQPVAKEAIAKVESDVVTKKITVPAGTRMVVRTNTALSTNKHATGHKFTAKLEADMVVDDVVVAPRGSTVYGVVFEAKKSRRLVGKSTMVLTFTDIMINNKMVAIKTSAVKAITEAEAKNTIKRTARAAAIGGLIDGSDGAKTGAKVGLGLALLSGGKSINIPAGTLLEFQIAAPFTP
ncbi:hypothetical protein CMT41_03435 [Colwellia sp. MT41]|uniref:hypothetical protein n=1 Tax=Colwellia sp. MT41 TaxID=58049 RepID=UPI0007179657|nr:hypothetical protein [Colwellia sp. MT41]ALO33882.1 hypothetical protein CMT41_03435 [Colwellia sp. MT41]